MSIKMMFVIVAFFMAIFLADDVHSVSVSNNKLTVTVPIEEVWDSLSSQGEKHVLMINFVAKTMIS